MIKFKYLMIAGNQSYLVDMLTEQDQAIARTGGLQIFDLECHSRFTYSGTWESILENKQESIPAPQHVEL